MIENPLNISEGQVVYYADKDFFGQVTDLFMGCFWLLDYNNGDVCPSGYYCCVDRDKLVVVDPDTPMNRLALVLKYS